MIYTVEEGKHDLKPNFKDFTWVKNHDIVKSWVCSFGSNCAYDLPHNEHLQLNKLVGFAKWHHHIESSRIAFRWNKETNKMDLFVYPYFKRKRLLDKYLKPVASVRLNEKFVVKMFISKTDYTIYINSNQVGVTPSKYKSYIGYTCGPYFGGETKAPHRMDIIISEI